MKLSIFFLFLLSIEFASVKLKQIEGELKNPEQKLQNPTAELQNQNINLRQGLNNPTAELQNQNINLRNMGRKLKNRSLKLQNKIYKLGRPKKLQYQYSISQPTRSPLKLISAFKRKRGSGKSEHKSWVTSTISHNNRRIKVVHSDNINSQKINKFLSIIDSSMISNTARVRSGNGFIQENDIICISNKMIYWFSLSPKGTRLVRSGGGLLAVMWEIDYKKDFGIVLKRVNDKRYVKNLLYPGSIPSKGLFGAEIYGGYLGSNSVWSLEHAVNTRTTKKLGKNIILYDKGEYASLNGVFIEFKGIVGNSIINGGIESLTDTDPRPGIIGKTKYILTYRIPADQNEIIQEVSFIAKRNNFGPIKNAYMKLFLPGYDQNKMVYAANTELMMKNIQMDPYKTEINSYFENSCFKEVFFYNVQFKSHLKKASALTPEGRGGLGCIGSPKLSVPFICGYPSSHLLPEIARNEFSLELFDNQAISKFGRFHGIGYKLFTSENKSYKLSSKKIRPLVMVMRYKVIPSFSKLNTKKKLSLSFKKENI